MAFDIEHKYIEEAERELEATLPLDYKSIMSKNNGGDIILNQDLFQAFPIFDKSTKKRISRTCNHIIVENARNKKTSKFS